MLSNVPRELLAFLLNLIVVVMVVVIVGGAAMAIIKSIKNHSAEQRNIIILTLISLFIAALSWVLNIGWLRVIMTFMLVPFIHAIVFFVVNFSAAKFVSQSPKIKKLNLFFIITYLLLYIFLPDGGDVGGLYLFFGLIHNDILAYVGEFVSSVAFVAHVVFLIMQVIEMGKTEIGNNKKNNSEADL
ncbi:MAG: hypothetical protein IJ435_09420 [Clostridia bacterium]|nr:hypothetical protein [Clostridia bacterium]